MLIFTFNKTVTQRYITSQSVRKSLIQTYSNSEKVKHIYSNSHLADEKKNSIFSHSANCSVIQLWPSMAAIGQFNYAIHKKPEI